jgi:hypothetical protein
MRCSRQLPILRQFHLPSLRFARSMHRQRMRFPFRLLSLSRQLSMSRCLLQHQSPLLSRGS